jgi:hypothetical protein
MLGMEGEPDALILEALELGEETRSFLNSKLGQYIVKRAEADIASALLFLQTADPEDAKTIRDLQTRIFIARAVPDWIDRAIKSAEQAFQLVTSRE